VRQSFLTQRDGIAQIAKPYRIEDLVSALIIVREFMTTGTSQRPLPAGMRLLPKELDQVLQATPI
jgi:hypothetical protein